MIYQQAIHTVVREAMATGGLTNQEILDPLVDEIGWLIANMQSVAPAGTDLDAIVEVLRHRLDQKVAEYVHQIRSR